MSDNDFYDDLETRSHEERERALFSALPAQIANAQRHAPAFANVLAGLDSAEIDSREKLSGLPVTRKSGFISLQSTSPPFGGLAAVPVGELARVFQSPGPIFEPEARRPDYWRMARAMYAAGFRSGDLVHNTFSYHFTPAGSMMETGAHALGCAVFPAGVGQTEMQVEAINHLRPRAYAGTPSFLRLILEKGKELGKDLSSLAKAFVSGEALPPSLRANINELGVEVLQGFATADLGLIAYETPAQEGLVCDEGIILEIVRPGTGDPVPEGEVGEIVVTTLNPDYPLIRFATGDLTAVLPGVSPCGRTNMRIKGWMGRADQTTKVKGMFVHPEQVAKVLKRHAEIIKGRLVVDQQNGVDNMTLHCEIQGEPSGDLADRIADSVRELCKLRGDVTFAGPGSLANDGKVIDDIRTYE